MENKDTSIVFTGVLESEKLGISAEVDISHQLSNSEGGQHLWEGSTEEPER